VMRHLLGLIADALQLVVDLGHAEDIAKFVGDRRIERQDLQAFPLRFEREIESS
jgi:hypothetical protein